MSLFSFSCDWNWCRKAVQLLLNYGCPPHVRIAGVSPLDLAIAACQAPTQSVHSARNSTGRSTGGAGRGSSTVPHTWAVGQNQATWVDRK